MSPAVVSGASAVLAHTPGLACYGSKPRRELLRDPELCVEFLSSLRTFEEALCYPPHRTNIGERHPRDLPARPWISSEAIAGGASRHTAGGEIMPEEEFLGLMAAVDEFGLITLDGGAAARAGAALAAHPLAETLASERLAEAAGDVEAALAEDGALALHAADGPVGAIRRAHEADEALTAAVLLENLAAKASAVLALGHLLRARSIEPGSIDYVIGCGEEAVGDRYQRGGGNLAKAVAAAAGLENASGVDVKNFCAAPIPALVIAASLVTSGVFARVAVWLCIELRVHGLPTFLLLRDGEELARISAPQLSPAQLREWLLGELEDGGEEVK